MFEQNVSIYDSSNFKNFEFFGNKNEFFRFCCRKMPKFNKMQSFNYINLGPKRVEILLFYLLPHGENTSLILK